MYIKASEPQFFQTPPPSTQGGLGVASFFPDADALPTPASTSLPNRGFYDIHPILAGMVGDDDEPTPASTSLPNRGFYDNTTLHQPHPCHGSRKDQSGWTFSLCSYLKAADELARCLIKNAQSKPYTWLATINVHQTLKPDEHKAIWARIIRRLKGLTAFWTREVSQTERIHYHLIITGNHKEQELRERLGLAVKDVGASIHVAQVKSVKAWCRYVVKARVAGLNDWGEPSSDKWASKRVLFTRHCGLSKHGCLGHFWATPLAQLKKQVSQEKRAYREQEQHNQALLTTATTQQREKAQRLHRLTGVPTKQILLTEVSMRNGIVKSDNRGLTGVQAAPMGDEPQKDGFKGMGALSATGKGAINNLQGELVSALQSPNPPIRSPIFHLRGFPPSSPPPSHRLPVQLRTPAQSPEPMEGGELFNNPPRVDGGLHPRC